MKAVLNKMVVTFAAVGVLSAGCTWAVFSANPGTDQDPLVTMSYVEKRVQEVMSTLNGEIAALKKQMGETTSTPPATEDTKPSDPKPSDTKGTSADTVFKVVQIEKGSFVYFGAGAEFIVRSGRAYAITTANGGLSDLTAGKDVSMNQALLPNHHILVPRDDGRGFSTQDTCYVMIKGIYTVTK